MEIRPGQVISSWTVIQKRPPQGDNKGAYWICRCVCGKEKPVRAVYLRNGASTGCGCRAKVDVNKQHKRFHSKYIINNNLGCWEWQGPYTRGNYGTLTINKKSYRAHRYAYELLVAPIPSGLVVCHKCDNPKCVNPKHLFLGTYKDNNVDCVLKNRHRWKK